MEAFVLNIFSYPTVFFTVILLLMVCYWLFAILGMVDIDVLELDLDIDSDLDSLTGLAGLMVTLGLTGVPVTLVLTLLALLGWWISYFIVHFFFFWSEPSLLSYVAGTAVIAFAIAASIPVTAQLIKPLKPLFKKVYTPAPEKVLLGQACRVRSTRVDENFGEATADLDGASLILKIRADAEKGLSNGDIVVLLEHRARDNTYWVIPENEFNQ
jgi:hypothetical protein